MKRQYHCIIQITFLCFVVLLVYCPAYMAEPCLLDDIALLKGLKGNTPLNIVSLLASNFTSLIYYRPIALISYWISEALWHGNPHAMHIENVAFHLLNVLLLFWLIKTALLEETKSRTYYPFLGALIFAVHPITTESVNWISGRTDLIACAFLLSAAIALTTWQYRHNSILTLLLSGLLIAGGILTKEVSWGFLLAVPFMLVKPYDSRTFSSGTITEAFSRKEKLLFVAIISLCYLLASTTLSFWPVIVLSVALGVTIMHRKPRGKSISRLNLLLISTALLIGIVFIPYAAQLLQQNAANSTYSNLNRTVLLISLDFDNSIGLFGAALSFYIKKLFIPLPLSFAISEIAPGYLFTGIATILLTAMLAGWRSQSALFFLTGIALLLPTLPLVHNQIAWSPYAERYIYISSGFWIASLAIAMSSIQQQTLKTSCLAICLVLTPIAGYISYQRSRIWQNNITLFADTVQKAPKHIEARILYMTVLSRSGNMAGAMEQYRRIQADPRSWLRVKYFKDLAEELYQAGFKQQAWEVLNTTIARPLPQGRVHPLKSDEWLKIYKLHERLEKELMPMSNQPQEKGLQ